MYVHYDQQPYLGESAILLEFCPYGEQGSVFPGLDVVFLQSVSECASFRHEGTVCGESSETPYWITLIHRDIKARKVLVRSLGSEDGLSSTRIVFITLQPCRVLPIWDKGGEVRHWGDRVLGTRADLLEDGVYPSKRCLGRESCDVFACSCICFCRVHSDHQERLKAQDELLLYPDGDANHEANKTWWCARAKRESVSICPKPYLQARIRGGKDLHQSTRRH